MYSPRGFSGSELGDIEVIAHEGVLHLFHLTLPNHDVIGHAVSEDGIVWEPRSPALTTGGPGSFDDDQLWTMSVLGWGGRFYMLYTALCRADAGRVQRVGLAVSDDLDTWEKLPGPVSEATSPFYRADRAGAPWVAWRDPKAIVLEDGRVHAVLCARDSSAPALRQGVVAHLVSDDMRRWESLPPLFASRRHFELECPQLFPFAGRMYLTAAILEERTQRYWMADTIDGPFVAPDDNRLCPGGHYAARVCRVGEESWVFAFHDPGGAPGLTERFVPAPLVLAEGPNGELTCHRTAGWDRRVERTETLAPDAFDRFEPKYRARGAVRDGRTFAAVEGAELFFWRRPGAVILRFEVGVDAPVFGIALSHGPGGAGALVELDRGARRIRVLSRAPATDGQTPWFSERVRAEGHYRPSSTMTVEVVRGGGELLVSVDGRLAVSTSHVSDADMDGVGILVDSGRVTVDGCTVADLRL